MKFYIISSVKYITDIIRYKKEKKLMFQKKENLKVRSVTS